VKGCGGGIIYTSAVEEEKRLKRRWERSGGNSLATESGSSTMVWLLEIEVRKRRAHERHKERCAQELGRLRR